MSLNVMPPSVESCHCTVGAGEPLAAAVKVAAVPLQTVCEAGGVVIAGAGFTVSVSVGGVGSVGGGAVPPVMVGTRSAVDSCHCMVWPALLVAAAVKLA